VSTSSRDPLRVLVAEGDLAERDLLDVVLSAGAFDVSFVSDGRQALSRLKEDAPDALIVARNVPGVPGDEVCERVRRVSRLASMVLVLIDDPEGALGLSKEQRALAERLGVDLIVPRPLGDKNLVARIEALHAERMQTPQRGVQVTGEWRALDVNPGPGGVDGASSAAPLAANTQGGRGGEERDVREVDAASLHQRVLDLEAQVEALKRENDALREALEKAEGERDAGDERRWGRSGR